jgi:hypothetical protein
MRVTDMARAYRAGSAAGAGGRVEASGRASVSAISSASITPPCVDVADHAREARLERRLGVAHDDREADQRQHRQVAGVSPTAIACASGTLRWAARSWTRSPCDTRRASC